jgi:hypothetical protein
MLQLISKRCCCECSLIVDLFAVVFVFVTVVAVVAAVDFCHLERQL